MRTSIPTALILSAALAASLASAATYYVAPPPQGNDSNAGTESEPWATLQYAADTVIAGDEVVVQAGDYVGAQITTSGTLADPIVFRAANGATVRITSDNLFTPDGINIEGADWIVIEGFTVDDRTRAGIRAVLCANVTIRDNSCDNNGRWGIFTGFCDDLLIEDNETSDSIDEHGIYVSNSGDRPVIRGNRISGNRGNGIHMNGDVSQGGDGIISDALVEENVIWDNGVGGGSGINMDGVQDSLIRNNLIYDSHASGISLYQIDGGAPSTGNRVLNNTVLVASDGRWALNIQDNSTGNEIRNNVFWSDHSYRGAMSVCSGCLSGISSDHNVVEDRLTLNDGSSVIDLDEWRITTGEDGASIVASPIEVFESPSGDDYHLRSGSPAINTGELRADVPRDLDGRSRPIGPTHDIGAYESTTIGDPPAAPSDLQATAMSGTTIDLIWSDNSDDEDSFIIYRSLDAGFVQLTTIAANNTSFSDSNLTPCVTATYRVAAHNAAGESAASNTDSATTDGSAPDPPTELAAIATRPNRIELRWSNGQTHQTDLEIQRATGEGPFASIAVLPGEREFYRDTAVAEQTSYTYQIRGLNNCGSSSWSESATTTTPPTGTTPLNPEFEWSPTRPRVGESTRFSGSSTAEPTTWSWNFGDGKSAEGQYVDHSFAFAGTYNVTLTVTLGADSVSLTHSITILGTNPVVAASAHKRGHRGTFWSTNMALTNTGDRSSVGVIRFLQGSGPSPDPIPFSIRSGGQTLIDDVVGTLNLSATGGLAIEVEEGRPAPQVMTRTFTPGPAGTYGHATPGMPPLLPGTYHLTGVRGGPGFRTNFGIAVPQGAGASVQLTLHLPSGALLGPRLDRPSGSMAQWGIEDIWGSPILAGVDAATLEVDLSAEAVVYIAVVDELSGDPVFISGVNPSVIWQIPLIGRGPGKRGTFWDTDAVIHNPHSGSTTVELEWLAADLDNRSGTPRHQLTLAPFETRLIQNVPKTLWEIESGNGSVMVTSTRAIVLEARTWTPIPDGLPGTMGQRIVPIDLSLERRPPTSIVWVREGSAVRTNIGFVNRSSRLETLYLELIDSTSAVRRNGEILLAPRSVSQRSMEFLFGENPLGEGESGWVRVTSSTSDQEVFCSQIANDSGDPIFVPGF